MIKMGIIGSTGRMGQALIQAIQQNEQTQLGAAIVRQGTKAVGQPASSSIVYSDRFSSQPVDVWIDFSTPAVTLECLRQLVNEQKPIGMVIGTTGFDNAQLDEIKQYSAILPIVLSANMSIGINVLWYLLQVTAAALPKHDVEIVEMHHRHKKDAPSGTALQMGEIIATARGQQLSECAVYGRSGQQLREQAEIGFAALRGGDVVGEHTAIFATEGERIEISHKASDRHIFARGALKAALWLVKQPAGLYTMGDVIGLEANEGS